MKGLIRLARVTTPVSTDSEYKCEIQALDTYSVYTATCPPSPYGWANPEVDALVYFLDAPYVKRIIGVLHDIDVAPRDIFAAADQEFVNPPVAVLHPGDVYVGKYGRAFFSQTGDVNILSFSARSELRFENETGNSLLSGYNLDIYTEGKPIRIFTENSTGEGIGDTLSIQSNTTGDEPKNLSTIKLDQTGGVTLRIGYADVEDKRYPTSNFDVLSSGIIQFFCSGETFGQANVSGLIDGPNKSMTFRSQVVGDNETTSATATILGDGTLKIHVGGETFDEAIVSAMMSQSAKEMRLKSTGAFFLDVTETANLTAKKIVVKADVDSTGKVNVTGDTSVTGNVGVKGNVSIEGDTVVKGAKVSLQASAVSLGGDGALALVVAQKVIAWLNSHTHPVTAPGSPSGPPIVPVTEAQIATIITKAK